VRARTPFTVPDPGQVPLQGIPLPTMAYGADGVQQAEVRSNIIGAEILESAVNYEIREMGFKQQVKLCILDAMFAWGVIKLGYDTEYTYHPVADAETKVKAETEGEEPRAGLEWNETIKRESVWAKRVSPWDFRWDPDIKQLDPWLSEARWVAFRTVRSLEDVKADPIYEHTKFLEATATSRADAEQPDKEDSGSRQTNRIPGDRTTTMDSPNSTDVSEGFVVLWEIWDKKDRRLKVMAEGHDKWLRDDDWPFEMEGPPFAFLHFHDVPDNPFPMSDFAAWFDQNELYNLCVSMDADAVKRRVSKILYQAGAITAEQLAKAVKPLNSQFCEVTNLDGIKPFKTDDSGMDATPFNQRLMYDIMQLSGIGENQRGATASGDKTASEQKIVEFNSQARIADEQDRVSDWATVAIRKIIQIMQQLFTKQRLAPIIGREPQEWVPYTKDQIQGQYDITVELSPYNPMKSELAIKQITDLIALLSKLFPAGQVPAGPGLVSSLNIAKLVESLLIQMAPIVKPQEVLMPLPPQPIPPMPPQAPGMGAPPQQGQNLSGGAPGMGPPGGAPLPGEGAGANRRSMLASQGAGQAMTQGVREQGNPMAGASSPSRGY
jgi:hypothetical protein